MDDQVSLPHRLINSNAFSSISSGSGGGRVRNAGLEPLGCSQPSHRSLARAPTSPRRPASPISIQFSLVLRRTALPCCTVLSYTLVFSTTLLWLLSRSHTQTIPLQFHPIRRQPNPPPLSRPAHLDTSVSAARALRRGDPLAPDFSTDTHYLCRRIRLSTRIDSRSPQSPVTALPARRSVAHTLQRP